MIHAAALPRPNLVRSGETAGTSRGGVRAVGGGLNRGGVAEATTRSSSGSDEHGKGEAMKAKVLITNFHPEGGGGHKTYIGTILKSKLADMVDIAVASPKESSILAMCKDLRIKCYPLVFPGNAQEVIGIAKSIIGLNKIYRDFPFSVIHCNGSRDHWIAVYWKLLFGKPTPIIRTRHAVKSVKNDLLHSLINLRLTSKQIYVCETMKYLCEEGKALKLCNSIVIPNGVDLDYYKPMVKDDSLAIKLGVGQDDFVFGSVAGLGRHKRVDLILQAVFEITHQRKIKVMLLGYERDSRTILGLAGRLGISDKVIYAGMVDDVRPYISIFDVGFVLSDAVDTISYAAREMMAMGTPLISSSYCGLSENVDDGINGVLVQPGSFSEVKRAMVGFLGMRDDGLSSFRAAAREKAVRSFSAVHQISGLERVYREAISSSGRS